MSLRQPDYPSRNTNPCLGIGIPRRAFSDESSLIEALRYCRIQDRFKSPVFGLGRHILLSPGTDFPKAAFQKPLWESPPVRVDLSDSKTIILTNFRCAKVQFASLIIDSINASWCIEWLCKSLSRIIRARGYPHKGTRVFPATASRCMSQGIVRVSQKGDPCEALP